MVNKSKQKGSDWEKKCVDHLNEKVDSSKWRRIPGSGAIGTTLGESLLTGDISGEIEGFYKKVKAEAKTGYGGETQLTVKKLWLDKIGEEASAINALPVLFGKFLGSRSGVKQFALMDLEVFIEMLNEYTSLKKDFDAVFTAYQELKNGHLATTTASSKE